MEQHLASSHPADCINTDFVWTDVNGKRFTPETAFLSNKLWVGKEDGTWDLETRTCIVSSSFLLPVLYILCTH